MRPFISILAAVSAAVLLAPGAARADIFHCVGADGRMVFRDTPCPKGSRTAAVTTYTPAEAISTTQEHLEEERATAEQDASLRRIQELEYQVAELRAALQAAQTAPAPAPVQQIIQEPVYSAIPVVIVPACSGRECKPNHRPHHDVDGDHHASQDGDRHPPHGRPPFRQDGPRDMGASSR